MKFDKQKAFPYPVLRPYSDDYLDVEFQSIVEFIVNEDKVQASLSYALSSEEIVEQIEHENALYVSIISCRDTYQRTIVKSNQSTTQVDFDINSLRGEIRVDPYVVACKDITNFMSPDINNEFGPGPFEFTAGEVLAQDESQVFYIDKDLFKPVTSVFEMVMKENLSNGEWSIGFEQNHIQIGVSQNMKGKIDNARNSTKKKAILLNSIYFSSVMQAIQKLREAPENFEEYKWAEVFQKKAHNDGLDLNSHDAYISAQRLMKHPLSILDHYVLGSEDE